MSLFFHLGAGLLLAASATTGFAQTLTWTGTDTLHPHSWSDTASTNNLNWTPDGATATTWTDGDTAIFGDASVDPNGGVVTLGSGVKVGGIDFTSGGWIIQSSTAGSTTQAVTFNDGAVVSVEGAGNVIAAPVSLAGGGSVEPGTLTVEGTESLVLSGLLTDKQSNAGANGNLVHITNNLSAGATLILSGGMASSSTSASTRMVDFNGSGDTVITGATQGVTALLGYTATGTGHVILNGGDFSQSAGLTVAAGAGVAGSGGNAGALTLGAATSHVAPGTPFGSLAPTTGVLAATSLTASNGLTFDLNVNGASAVSLLQLSGNVIVGGVLTLNVADLGMGTLSAGTVYDIMMGSGGAWTGNFSDVVVNNGSGNFVLDSAYGTDGVLFDPTTQTLSVEFSAAPEPPSWTLLFLGGGVALLGMRIRRLRTGISS